MPQPLERQTFRTSRLAEFFTEKELRQQIGYDVEQWPLAILKELIDNALDACETAGIPPRVDIDLGSSHFEVADNGPGLPQSTLMGALDYSIRVSDKAYYVAPTRGQLGNALMTTFAAPYVAEQEGGVQITTMGKRHHIELAYDPIAQTPTIRHSPQRGAPTVGTKIRVRWPGVASYWHPDRIASFYKPLELVRLFALFNPHASFTCDGRTWEALDGFEKWSPSYPTPPHWYSLEAFSSLIAAYLSAERGGSRRRTVREFVSEFRGLSGTAKQQTVCELAGLAGYHLDQLIEKDQLDAELIRRLLSAMRQESREVKPDLLGVIGEKHITERLVGEWGVAPSSIRYKKVHGTRFTGGANIPYVLEFAFGMKAQGPREILCGLNWSPTLRIPSAEVNRLLGAQRVDRDDPVVIVVHIASPMLPFVDRGKSLLELVR